MAPEAIVEGVPVSSIVEEPAPPRIESAVWRLGPGGTIISSVPEQLAATLAELEDPAIYFYADLQSSDKLKNDEETAKKVYRALGSVGLTERQIIVAVNRMQQDGIVFRDSAI